MVKQHNYYFYQVDNAQEKYNNLTKNFKEEYEKLKSENGFILREVELTGINNEKIIPETENGILKTPISNTKSLKLNYKQNSFSFLFTSNNYINPEKNNFKYRLKNFDDILILFFKY